MTFPRLNLMKPIQVKNLRICVLLGMMCFGAIAHADPLVFKGDGGPGAGKHIVLIAGDHEYRSEETLPALGRLLAKHYGFKCTVLFNIDPDTGEIVAGKPSNIPGMEALDTADLAVVFLRFQNLPADQMKHFVDYLGRGGPVVGLRTSTHAFKIPASQPYTQYSFDSETAGYELGFGHQVLGQTWVGHYGRNHRQSTRISVVGEMSDHPILRGVKDVWVQAGCYVGKPTDGKILTMAQPLDGMTADSPASKTQPPMPSEWTRTYKSDSGKEGRVFASQYGASEDLTNAGYRRLLVNGVFWAIGLDDAIAPEMNVDLVGPYQPNTFGNQTHARGIKPESYAGFQSPIPAHNDIVKPASKKKPAAKKKTPANKTKS